MGGGGGWEAEGRFFHTLEQKSTHVPIVCSWKYRKGHSVRTCQAEKVVASSLTSRVALIGCPSGTVHPTVTVMDLQGHKHDASKSRPSGVSR